LGALRAAAWRYTMQQPPWYVTVSSGFRLILRVSRRQFVEGKPFLEC
jgi:hypothetical protein